MGNTTQWKVRRFRPGDRPGILELYRAVHGEAKAELARENWVWEFEAGPCIGRRPFVWVAEADGRIVGLHPAIPVFLRHGPERIRALWSVDLMTHPDYRGRGIFKTLTERLIEESRHEGISVFLVLPNRYSGPLLRRRGWFDVATFPVMIKPLRWVPLLRQISLRSLPKAVAGGLAVTRRLINGIMAGGGSPTEGSPEVKITESFDSRFDGLFERVAGEYDFIAVRDKRYLDWRYGAYPGGKYTVFTAERGGDLLGFMVVSTERSHPDRGQIAELLAAGGPQRGTVISGLLEAGTDHLARRDVATIEICSPGEPYTGPLARAGFVEVPSDVFWGYNLVAYCPDGSPVAGTLRDPKKKWYLSKGDADSDMALG